MPVIITDMTVNDEISVPGYSFPASTRSSLLASLNPERTMEIALESIRELVDYELAVILILESGDTLKVRKAMGPLARPRLLGYELSLRERPDLAALLAGGIPRLFDTASDYVDTYAELLDCPAGHSCMAAPLIVDGSPIGLLTLDHRSCGLFSAEIVRFIGLISRLIAVALLQTEAALEFRGKAETLLAERNRLLDHNADIFRDLVGRSGAWTRVLDSLRLVAATNAPVLLLGETGSGKEEAALAIHRLSGRAGGPFIALNCSALPAGLAESELFGHEKGSFTGAQGLRRGRFELADGGSLFLDEVGELPLEIQPKLLRVLQEGRFERVGGERPVSVDLRILAATKVDLGRAVDEGRFREDLFYRLAVFPIRMPPLSERGDDALVLAELFASKLRLRPGWGELRFTADALRYLAQRTWPGNVRELRNVVERAAILARGGTIGPKELTAGDWAGSGDAAGGRIGKAGEGEAACDGELLSLDEEQRRHIARALTQKGGRIYGQGGAAELLGIKPSTLQSRMKKLGMDRRTFIAP
jgi:transcriptional regulator with GAF, ATPase, and Fis domain